MSQILACRALLALTLLTLVGCAAPLTERFYTLAAATTSATNNDATSPANFYIELLAVDVPQQVRRSQLVIRTKAGRIQLLEQERWAAPLAAEIKQALSLAVSSELGAIDVYRTPYPDHAPVYRISTNVQRFESLPGQHALLDMVWSVRPPADASVLTCRSVVTEKVEAGYDALVAGTLASLARATSEWAVSMSITT